MVSNFNIEVKPMTDINSNGVQIVKSKYRFVTDSVPLPETALVVLIM